MSDCHRMGIMCVIFNTIIYRPWWELSLSSSIRAWYLLHNPSTQSTTHNVMDHNTIIWYFIIQFHHPCIDFLWYVALSRIQLIPFPLPAGLYLNFPIVSKKESHAFTLWRQGLRCHTSQSILILLLVYLLSLLVGSSVRVQDLWTFFIHPYRYLICDMHATMNYGMDFVVRVSSFIHLLGLIWTTFHKMLDHNRSWIDQMINKTWKMTFIYPLLNDISQNSEFTAVK